MIRVRRIAAYDVYLAAESSHIFISGRLHRRHSTLPALGVVTAILRDSTLDQCTLLAPTDVLFSA